VLQQSAKSTREKLGCQRKGLEGKEVFFGDAIQENPQKTAISGVMISSPKGKKLREGKDGRSGKGGGWCSFVARNVLQRAGT